MRQVEFLVVVAFLCVTIIAGICISTDRIPLQNLSLPPDNHPIHPIPSINPNLPSSSPSVTDQHIGDIDTVGTTWYDLQHIGSCGRMICLDELANINVCWMNGLQAGAASRHIYYNFKQLDLGWTWESGIPVESFYRAGYCSIDLDTSGYPIIVFHGNRLQGDPARIYLSMDMFPPYGAFATLELPPPPTGVEDMVWPKVAVDRHNRIHVIAHENPTIAGHPFRIFYTRDGMNVWHEVDRTMTHAADITASRHFNRVGIVYTGIRPTIYGEINSVNNDLYMVISEDGVTWDFADIINITNFIYPDPANPNPVIAKGDTFRVYNDASLLLDDDDDIHVAFTTIHYDEINYLSLPQKSLIWYWSEEINDYCLIANGWFDNVPYECGAGEHFVQRPCLAQNEVTGHMFLTYQMYDTSDVSMGGYLQSEVMVSRSNWILHNYWSVGTNVTNTHAPGAGPDSCRSERDITCNETIVRDTLHLFYIVDKDAGNVGYGGGTWTLNPAMCQYVPISEIPETPYMPQIAFHIDTTTSMEQPVQSIPQAFQLHQNYPNPFNPTTTITFDLNHPDHVTLKIYNILGREVATLVNAHCQPGTYKISFDAPDLASGIYFCRLSTPSCTLTCKMVLIK